MKKTVIKIDDGDAVDIEHGHGNWQRFMGPCVVTIVEED